MTHINNLLEKYWKAEATLQEEAQIKAYFSTGDVAQEHMQYAPLFIHFDEQSQMSSGIEIKSILTNVSDIDALIEKYYSAETSLEEERQLKAYLNDDQLPAKYNDIKALFGYYDMAQGQTMELDIAALISDQDADIDELVARYWKAETSLEEEQQLRSYLVDGQYDKKYAEVAALMGYYTHQAQATTEIDIESVIQETEGHQVSDQEGSAPKEAKARVISLRKMMSAVAAIFVLGFAAVTVMNSTKPDTQYKGKFVQLDEEADAQEAYEITKQALALLSSKMKKGSDTVSKSVSKAEAAKIFKK